MDSIDLRSDTVSWPTPEMRQAMASAEVGDDVWGDDPTAKRLEALSAERMGKEAGLFVTSGTMGNLVAVLAHCQRGDEIIVGYTAHTFRNEVGGVSALGGVQPHTIPFQPDGTLPLDAVRMAIRNPNNLHHPPTRLICLENTNGSLGGLPLTAEYTRQVRALADEHGLLVHLDGARVWNAATALGCPVTDLTEPVDSVSFCLSKGLCAPIGSVLCGPAEFIQQARKVRKMLGGGMRQVGVIAAAGLVAVEKMTQRLGEDHANARRLAEGLQSIPGIGLDTAQVQTNMVFFWLEETAPMDASQLAAALRERHNVKIGVTGPRQFRAVAHYWITPEGVQTAVEAIREVLAEAS
jgi:threonine aldolase